MYLVYLDAYHLEDPLFASSVARMLGRLGPARPACLFVHGSSGRAERLLEAEGLFSEREDGVVPGRSPEESAVVERAAREVNQGLVAQLTDEGVHAVGVQGMDRGVLRMRLDGTLEAGTVDWLRDLAAKGVVAVVSVIVRDPNTGRPRAVPPHRALEALHPAFGPDATAVIFTRSGQPGVVEDGQLQTHVHAEAVAPDLLPEPEALRGMLGTEGRLLLSSPSGLFGAAHPQGTRILDQETS